MVIPPAPIGGQPVRGCGVNQKTGPVASEPADPRRAMVVGTLWSVAMRWSNKGLGLISTLVLARILTPGDYGVVAMAMLIVGLAEVLIDFGANTALLREPNADRDFSDSAWTLGAIQGVILGVLLAFAAPLAGVYFKEPRVVSAIWVVAPFVALSAFSNIGITLARKQLNFAFEFRYLLACKLIGVVATVSAAFVLRDFHALLIGVSAGYSATLLLSYLMHPYRPRWCTRSFAAMWNFSKWLLIGGIGQFAIRKIDELAAGRLGSASQFGAYTVGADIGQLVTAEVGPPINRTLLPTLSSMHEDVERMRQATLKVLAVVATVVLPLGVGMALVASAATQVLLGAKWDSATPFVAIFALVGAVRVLSGPFWTLLLVLGRSRLQASNVWIEFAVFAIAAVALVPTHDFVGLAYARLISAVAITVIYLITAHVVAELSWTALAQALWRPLVGVGAMALVLPMFADPNRLPLLQLAISIGIGAVLYASWIAGSWWLAGRPDGIERMVFDRLGARSQPQN